MINIEERNTHNVQKALSLNVVVTGTSEDKRLMEKLSAADNRVYFVHMKEHPDLERENISFKNMQPAINYAQQHGYDMVIGADTVYNKVLLAVRKQSGGSFQLLNVHQLAVLFTSLWIDEHQNEELMLVKSSQVTEMIDKIAAKERVQCINMVIEQGSLPETADEIAETKGNAMVLGFTENQEFYENQEGLETLLEKLVEWESKLRDENKTLFDKLVELYQYHGFYREKTFTVNFVSDAHREQLLQRMDDIRKNPDFIRERLKVVRITDYKKGKSKNLLSQNTQSTHQSGYNILKLDMENGSSVTFAPAEDKMYYYVGMKEGLNDKEHYAEANRNFNEEAVRLMQTINKL